MLRGLRGHQGEEGEDKSRRFAGAGLGDTHQVVSLKDDRDSGGLNWGGLRIACVLDGVLNRLC